MAGPTYGGGLPSSSHKTAAAPTAPPSSLNPSVQDSEPLIFLALDLIGTKDFFLGTLLLNQHIAVHWIMTAQ